MHSGRPSNSEERTCVAALQQLASIEVETPLDVMLPRLLEVVVRAMASDRGELHLAAEEGETPVRVAKLGEDMTGDGVSVERFRLPMKAAGSLHIGRKGVPFSAEELRWAHMLASQVGVRIENARFYAEAQKRLHHVSLLLELARAGAESSDPPSVLERAMASIQKAFATEVVAVHLVVDGQLVLRGERVPGDLTWQTSLRRTGIPLDATSLVGRAGCETRTVQTDAEHWPAGSRAVVERLAIRFGAATPMLAGDRLVGVLSIVRTTELPFAADDIRMLESCAAQLTAVVEHARIFDAEQRRARDLAVINEVGALVSQHLDISAILAIGVRQMTRVAGVSRTELLLLEPEREVLRLVAASPEAEGIPNLIIPMHGTSLAQLALASGKPVWTADAMNDPRASNQLARRSGFHAILAVPLVTDGASIGVVALCDRQEGRRFSDAEVETVVAISNQLATALANARLFEDLRRSYEKLAKTQEQLIGQERLAALGELAAVMAHEVRNPLAIIFNAIASLKKLGHPAGDARTLLDIVAEEAGQLNRIVGDLLDFARPHDPVFRPESLEDLVWAALESAKGAEPSRDIEFAVAIGAELPTVSIDARLLKQALINLLTNSIQALPEGGRIEIRVARAASDEDAIEVSVVDDGPGISREIGGRVLQPFFTTKPTGTGLGLAIVKRIAETHDGDLILTPTPGGGTTSTLRLPLRQASASPARAG